VNVLHKHTLVLEDITLGFLVENMVEMFVDLASLPVLPQQPPQHSLSPHPQNLCWHSRFCSTFSFTRASMTTLPLCSKKVAGACSRVDSSGFDNNATILDEFLNVCARICISNFSLFSGVKPDFTLANACDTGSEAFL